jgi:DNA-binding IclR family transcriptional regulator
VVTRRIAGQSPCFTARRRINCGHRPSQGLAVTRHQPRVAEHRTPGIWQDAAGLPPDRAAEQAAVRKRGWAAGVAEREPGVASVSAPILAGLARLAVS